MVSDDEKLVQCCLAGDQKAYQDLVRRYQKKLFSVAYGMVHQVEDSLDLVQEAFLKCFRNLPKFQGQSSFYTWIYRILINLCIDFLRKEKRQPTEDYDDAVQRMSAAEGLFPSTRPSQQCYNPDKAMSNKELGEQIYAAIECLTVNHRAVIILREIEGMSYDQIAEQLDCSKGTVMSRLHHARSRLRQVLTQYIEHEESIPSPHPTRKKQAAC